MEWKKNIRETGLFEWVCEHGIGHPDMKSANDVASRYREWETEDEHGNQIHTKESVILTWRMHGCDGCCGRKDFPGKLSSTV